MGRHKWKDRLRKASYRGIKFHVDTSTFSTGRRGTTHEFPGRSKPYREDSGRKAHEYPVEGFLLGDNYQAERDRLIDAAEKGGTGELIHPYYGRVMVDCEDLQVHESAGEGGFCKLTFKFVESGEILYPTAATDSKFQVGQAAAALEAAAAEDFASKFSVLNQAAWVVDSVQDKVGDFADKVDEYSAGIKGSINAIADLAFGIRNIKATIRDLAATPAKLAAALAHSMALLRAAGNASDVRDAFRKMFTFGQNKVASISTTPGRKQEGKNDDALNGLILILAATNASGAAVESDYASTDDAQVVRDAIGDHLDALMDTTDNDTVYSALQNLRTAVVQAIPASDQNLARIALYTPKTTVPSLALAYDLYGSLEFESDLIDRNKVQHPGFLLGGRALEILDRG